MTGGGHGDGTAAGSRILGIGACRPARVVPNEEICAHIDSSDAWIRRRSGIATRRFAGADETVVTMAAESARKALAQAGADPADVDAVLVASMSHFERAPAAAPQVAHLVGADRAGAMDVRAACAGFCHALALADALVRARSGLVLVIGAEKMSDILDLDDRGTAFLFGDGAGAVVVGPAAEPGIGPVVWTAQGEFEELITYRKPDTDAPNRRPVLRMAGPEVFRWAVRTVPDIARRAMEAARIQLADLAAFVPHQANLRIVEAAAKALDLPPEVYVARDVVDEGNTSAASIPLALDRLVNRGGAPRGGRALLIGFGAGVVQAAQVVTLP